MQWVQKLYWNSLGTSDKGKNDVTTSYLADPELCENLCY